MKVFLAYITVLITAFTAFSQNRADTVKVYFRVGQNHLDPSFADNRKALQAFDSIIMKAAGASIDSLVIRGSSSPEGNSYDNQRLAERRAKSLSDYIVRKTGIDPALINVFPQGVAWDELRTLVVADPDVPRRKEILDIIDNVPVWIPGADGRMVDVRKKRLMNLDNGRPYRWMLKHIFPELRNAVAVAVYSRPQAEQTSDSNNVRVEAIQEFTLPIVENLTDTIVISEECMPDSLQSELPGLPVDSLLPVSKRRFRMAFKTNMLYDAALIPNIGAEFYLGRSFSVYGEWMYAWWDNDERHRFWRVYGGDLGLRWWFGKNAAADSLCGHHLGIYGGVLTFDFEIGDYGYMGGKPGGTLWDRNLVNAGIEYGFSLPVAKRLNIDFSIGVGYFGGNYIKYYPFDNDYYFDKEYKMRYFGPTKAEISLVWLIGPGNSKFMKGGEE